MTTDRPLLAKPLMVLVPDRLSDLQRKGEVTARYYNPGDMFDEVHLVMTNDDRPDADGLQKMVGRAKLHLHNLPGSRWLFPLSLGWRPWLLNWWAERAVALAREIQPALIRCHGARLNAFAAARIKQALGIPYVVSLHINPDVDVRARARGPLRRLVAKAQWATEHIGLANADLVMPVYRPIVPYLERIGISRFEVCYNSLNPDHLCRKDDYRLHDPVRIVSVGRQFDAKYPLNLVRAVASLQGVHLTLIGDGSHHEMLRQVVADAEIGDRVAFHRSLPNDELCAQLPNFDIFATHSEYWELSKSVLEGLLTGLPLVINRRLGEPVPELSDDICLQVSDTATDYRQALTNLIADHAYREELGRAAYLHAQAHWSPARTEQKFVNIYRRVLECASGGSGVS